MDKGELLDKYREALDRGLKVEYLRGREPCDNEFYELRRKTHEKLIELGAVDKGKSEDDWGVYTPAQELYSEMVEISLERAADRKTASYMVHSDHIVPIAFILNYLPSQ